MPALSDQTFNPTAWTRLSLVALGLSALAGLIWGSSIFYDHYVEAPRQLGRRFDDGVGRVGSSTTRIAKLGAKAVPVLLGDLDAAEPRQRSKALELLSAIEDPRVLPALALGVKDPDIGVRLAGVSGLARTGNPEAAVTLWLLADGADDFVRPRAIVALGVIGAQADADRLLLEAVKTDGGERYLLAWSAGRILRRLERMKDKGFLPAAPVPVGDADAQRIQMEVDLIKVSIDAGQDLPVHARRLNEMTDLGFATWDLSHQIAAQVLAVHGPLSVIRAHGAEEMLPPRPSQRRLELESPK